MKIKKIGKVSEEIAETTSKIQEENKPTKNSGFAKIIIIITGILIVVAGVLTLLYFFVYQNDNNDSVIVTTKNPDDELKQKELDLKERELKLKEKQLNQSSSDSFVGQTKSPASFETQAVDQVKDWITALGKRDFSKAFYMLSKSKRGDYSKFSSTKGYGGITSTTILNCALESSNGCTAEITAEYEAVDPSNRSGKYKQRFFINNCAGLWEITEMKTLNINFY